MQVDDALGERREPRREIGVTRRELVRARAARTACRRRSGRSCRASRATARRARASAARRRARRNSACSSAPRFVSMWHDHWNGSASNGRVPAKIGTAGPIGLEVEVVARERQLARRASCSSAPTYGCPSRDCRQMQPLRVVLELRLRHVAQIAIARVHQLEQASPCCRPGRARSTAPAGGAQCA